MTAVLNFTRESQMGFKARKLRIAQHMSQQKLADMAGVTKEAVDLFEHNLPLPLDCRRRILRELWAQKTRSDARSITPCAKSLV
ncbi:MAG: helix-turn-helix transcriptional regulator [Dehalococcoidales bacterium]|jgi:DNA-binding XRE family transcriptional regulator